MKLLGFPGWSCTQNLDEWFGYPITVLNHFEQMESLKTGKQGVVKFLPNSDESWGMVTWSMGTRIGLCLSGVWEKNPPKVWIALSPFLNFTGENASNSLDDVKQLKTSLLEKPEVTLKLFARSHGVKKAWMDLDITEKRLEILSEALDLLCEPTPIPSKSLNVPCYTFLGSNDRLVNNWMVNEFSDALGVQAPVVLDGLSHALFYEQPNDLKSILGKLGL